MDVTALANAAQAMGALQRWHERGTYFLWRGHRVFVASDGVGPPLVLIHGYPTSSYDWHRIWKGLARHNSLIALDLLGLGFSDKPRNWHYDIASHADLLEDLLVHRGCPRVRLLVHDLGVSVAQELLARQLENRHRISIEAVVMLNGGLCPDAYRPRPIQRLLASPLGGWIGPHIPRAAFDRSIQSLFAPGAPAEPQLLDDFWALATHNEGLLVAHAVGRFWQDRLRLKDRLMAPLLHGGVAVRLINGAADPNSGWHMAERYRALVPDADVVRLARVGHWPHIEQPAATTDAILQFLEHPGVAGPCHWRS